MRVSSFPPVSPAGAVQPVPSSAYPASNPRPDAAAQSGRAQFLPFSAQAFDLARSRHVPVFLVIGTLGEAFDDPALSAQIRERTVPVHLLPGERPDIELLCQRAGALFSDEGALPLCALLQSDARPFLAAPLPPAGFELDPARLYAWLYQADKRFTQSPDACALQATQVMQSLRAPALRAPYGVQDAVHDLSRALSIVEDRKNGGFGGIKSPMPNILRYLQHEAARADSHARAALSRALDAMLASPVYDPLDGSFFRAALTDDWRVFIPEKPLGVNALLALTLLDDGRRSEAVRTLDFLSGSYTLAGGGLAPCLYAPRDYYAFTPEQVCAALGNEDGLRASRLLNLRRQHAGDMPNVLPSRFSPMPPDEARSRLPLDAPALTPSLSGGMTPADTAFLRRVMPALLRARNGRTPPSPDTHVLTQDCALAAAVLAHCGHRLGEARYIQTAQRAVSFLTALPSAATGQMGLPPSCAPVSPLHAQATCGASAALALALLTLGQGEGMEAYLAGGLRLLSGAIQAFLGPSGLPLHTPHDPASLLPRIPALYDGELPSPAALLVRCLRLSSGHGPAPQEAEILRAIWSSCAPTVRAQPLACASLIDAMAFG